MPVTTRSKQSNDEMMAAARILMSMRTAPAPKSRQCCKQVKFNAAPAHETRPRRSCANYEAGVFADMDDSVEMVE